MNDLPPQLQLNFVEGTGKSDTNQETEEENPNFVYEEDSGETQAKLDLPSIEKEDISQDIFVKDTPKPKPKVVSDKPKVVSDKPKPKVAKPKPMIQPVKEDPILPESEDVGGLDTAQVPKKPVKLNKNGKPRKQRVITDEQREQMRERMKHARAMRSKNKGVKQEEKEKEKKFVELKKKTKELEIKEMEDKLQGKVSPAKAVIDKDIIKQAQLDAIVEYETLRKARKKKKKEEEMIRKEQENLKATIQRELDWTNIAGKYRGCY